MTSVPILHRYPETTKMAFFSLDAVTRASFPIVRDSTTILWTNSALETVPATLNTSFNVDSFTLTPNKISSQDEIWQDIDRFLSKWDASGQVYDLDNEWLNETRAASDSRFDDLYGPTGWE